jgi:hypothetical protein
MTRGEVLDKTVTLPPKARVTLDVNNLLGFHGSCDEVAIHPYKDPKDWGYHYGDCARVLRSRGVWQELVVTEIGCPNASSLRPDPYTEDLQYKAFGMRGMGGLLQNGCRKMWIYKDIDEDPGTSWDGNYYGLFDYLGNPHPAWYEFIQWQSQFPNYPLLPTNWTPQE